MIRYAKCSLPGNSKARKRAPAVTIKPRARICRFMHPNHVTFLQCNNRHVAALIKPMCWTSIIPVQSTNGSSIRNYLRLEKIIAQYASEENVTPVSGRCENATVWRISVSIIGDYLVKYNLLMVANTGHVTWQDCRKRGYYLRSRWRCWWNQNWNKMLLGCFIDGTLFSG